MIRIGEFSKMAKTTIKTLRYYDEINLFKPMFVDDNGYRYYAIEQLNELNQIVELRSFDVAIEDIISIKNGKDLQKILSAHLQNLLLEKKQISNSIVKLKQYLSKVEKGESMENYNPKEIIIPDYDVYYRHGIIPSMNDLFDFVLQAGSEARENNPTLKCLDYCYITYTAKEYKEKDVELEYVEAVDGKVNESENIKSKHVIGGKAISIYLKGSYSKLAGAYAFVLNWVQEKGYTIAGDLREVYIDGCWNKDSEDDYLTEIQVPVK